MQSKAPALRRTRKQCPEANKEAMPHKKGLQQRTAAMVRKGLEAVGARPLHVSRRARLRGEEKEEDQTVVKDIEGHSSGGRR